MPLDWVQPGGERMTLRVLVVPARSGRAAPDPLVYLAVVAVLGIAVLLAAWLPARRALRVDPMVALRNE